LANNGKFVNKLRFFQWLGPFTPNQMKLIRFGAPTPTTVQALSAGQKQNNINNNRRKNQNFQGVIKI
jgi:hypothetical protein